MKIKKLILFLLLLLSASTMNAQTVTLLDLNFRQSQGNFTIKDVTLPASLSAVWVRESAYGMKATAYANSTNYASESWLISEPFDLFLYKNAKLSFKHAINYFSSVATAKQEATVWVSADGGTSWKQIQNVSYPTSMSWTFVSSGELDLSEYDRQKIQIAFKYTSTATKAGTWEIQSVTLTAENNPIEVVQVNALSELQRVETGSYVQLNFTKEHPAIIQYVYPENASRTANEQEAFVRDHTAAVVFKNFIPDDLGWHTAKNGGLVGSVVGKYVLQNGMPTIISAETSSGDNILCLENKQLASPTEITVSELATSAYRADFVKLQDVSLKQRDGKYYVTDGTTEVLVGNDFNVSGISYPAALTGYRFNLTGIVSVTDAAESKLSLLSLDTSTARIDLFDYESNGSILTAYNGMTVDAYVSRSLQLNEWNTLCLPFNLADVSDVLGNLSLAEFTGYKTSTNTLEFTTTNSLVAGKPYLIMPNEDLGTVLRLGAVTITNELSTVQNGMFSFIPTVDPIELSESDNTILVLDNASSLSRPSGIVSLGAFQGYFKATAAVQNASISIDGVPTGITLSTLDAQKATPHYYDVEGRSVGTSLQGVQRGIYVSKGEKRIVK